MTRIFKRVRSLLKGCGLLAALAAVCLCAVQAQAQRTTGTLRGQVLDPTEAVVPGATVVATNQDTNVSQTTATTSAGSYVFPDLLPGRYTVSVEDSGFKKSSLSDVSVVANQVNEADLRLEIGQVSEMVNVTAAPQLVETTNSTLSSTFTARQVVDLPTGLSSPLNLAMLAPGATAQQGGVAGEGGSIGGARPRANSFNIDGVDDNNAQLTGHMTNVINDAVSEFNLVTNQFSAEYSHSAAGQFNTVTKTGTNNWHGSGFEYLQNRYLNALDNLTQDAIRAKTLDHVPHYDQSEVGGTVGGPILKNRWFIFGAYQYTDQHAEGTATTVTVPTAAGFTTLNTLAADQAVKDKLTVFPVAPASDAGSITVNGQTIPVGNDVLFSPNFNHEHDIQISSDYTIGRHQIGARYLFNNVAQISPTTVANTPQPQFNQTATVHDQHYALTDAGMVSSQFVNTLRAGYSHYIQAFVTPVKYAGYSDVTLTDLGRLKIGPNDPTRQLQDEYQLQDTASYVRGRHSLKFGAEGRHYIAPNFFLPRSVGDYVYTDTQEFINDQVAGFGSTVGNTLRGVGKATFLATQSAFYWFAQDDFKATPRLTLNLGLRYEFVTNPRDAATQAMNSVANVPGAFTFRNPRTDINNFAPRVGFAWDPTGEGKWSVRGGFGVAYDVIFGNLVQLNLPPELQSELNPDIACTLTPNPAWCAAYLAGATGTHGFLAGGGLPGTFIPNNDPVQNRHLTQSLILDTVQPKTLNWSLGVQHELYHGASLEVRYVGTRGLSLPVQVRLNQISAFDAGLKPMPTYLNASDIPANVPLTGISTLSDYNNFKKAKGYLRFGAQGFLGNVTADPPVGFSIYHGASADFKQTSRFGLTFRANYTYSHDIDNSTNELFTSLLNPRRAQDGYQIRAERGNSGLDVRHKAAISWVYDFPRTHYSSWVARAITSGFAVSGTMIAQTGQPVTALSFVDANVNNDSAGDRAVFNPHGIGNTATDASRVCRDAVSGATSIDSSCAAAQTVGYVSNDPHARFITANRGTLATSGRNTIFSPGFSVWNVGLFKNTYVTESKYIQFQAQFFNFFNHPSFTVGGVPSFQQSLSNALGSPQYVQVTSPANNPDFLNSHIFSGGSRNIQLALKFIF